MPVINDLRPRPRFPPQHMYVGDGSKVSLQEQMGLQSCEDIFAAILHVIRRTCAKHGMNLNVPYGRQDPVVLDMVHEKLLERIAVLREFEDGWPVTFYLRSELKVHYPSQSTCHKEILQLRHSHRVSGSLGTRRSVHGRLLGRWKGGHWLRPLAPTYISLRRLSE
ncbi:hypothetical protein L226DRAFT_559404, partial [Lentinus tigrinus ALCF2SS1-7]